MLGTLLQCLNRALASVNFFFSFSLIHNNLTVVSPPSTLPSAPHTFPLPQIHTFSVSLKKGIPTEPSIMNYNKTRHKPSVISRLDKATQ